jgi:hypothetical protein
MIRRTRFMPLGMGWGTNKWLVMADDVLSFQPLVRSRDGPTLQGIADDFHRAQVLPLQD